MLQESTQQKAHLELLFISFLTIMIAPVAICISRHHLDLFVCVRSSDGPRRAFHDRKDALKEKEIGKLAFNRTDTFLTD